MQSTTFEVKHPYALIIWYGAVNLGQYEPLDGAGGGLWEGQYKIRQIAGVSTITFFDVAYGEAGTFYAEAVSPDGDVIGQSAIAALSVQPLQFAEHPTAMTVSVSAGTTGSVSAGTTGSGGSGGPCG